MKTIKPPQAARMLGMSVWTFRRKYCRRQVEGLRVIVEQGPAGQPVYRVVREDVERLVAQRLIA